MIVLKPYTYIRIKNPAVFEIKNNKKIVKKDNNG